MKASVARVLDYQTLSNAVGLRSLNIRRRRMVRHFYKKPLSGSVRRSVTHSRCETAASLSHQLTRRSTS